MGKLQKQDFKTEAELVSLGSSAVDLLNDTQIYVTANSINKTLDDAITDGDIGSGSGGGVSSLDVFYSESFETTNAADFSTGNNATFLTAGTLAGTLADEDASPLSGTSSLKFTQAAGSLNDWVASPVITIDPKERGQLASFTQYFKYTGNDNDIKFVAWDVTNSQDLSDSLALYKASSNPQRFAVSIFIPASCTQMRWGFQVKVANASAVLTVDDVEGTLSPFSYQDLLETKTVFAASNSGQSVTANVTDVTFDEVSDVGGLWSGSVYTVKAGFEDVHLEGITQATAGGHYVNLYVNGSSRAKISNIADSTNGICKFAYREVFSAGDQLSLRFTQTRTLSSGTLNHNISIVALGKSEHIISAVNTADYENVFSARINNNGTASVVSESSSFISSVSRTAAGRVRIIFDTNFFSQTPHVVSLVSGNPSLENNTIMLDTSATYSAAELTIGTKSGGGDSDENFIIVLQRQGTDYRDPSKALIMPLQQTAILKDVKTSGTSGGSSSATTVHTRTLNTVEGDSSLVSLSANQFTLQPGKYVINASAPAFSVDTHQIFLYSVTGSSYVIDGTSMSANSANAVNSTSALSGVLELTSATTYELRHWTFSAKTTNGLGIGVDGTNNPQTNEVFSVVQIDKIK